jgi:glycerol-3-phosphate acyltransferase PlsY
MRLLIAMILAYFVGSIPTALWLGRALTGKDIREFGSGNLGATNACRVLGKKIGLIVLFADMLKGLAPVALFPGLLGMHDASSGTYLAIGAAAILGHIFSCFVHFRGGKGVATSMGVFLAIAPKAMIALIVIGIVIIWLTGYVSAAAIAGAVLLPIFFYFSRADAIVLFFGELIAIIIIIRHKANLQRLFEGRESRFYERSRAGDDQRIQFVNGPPRPPGGSPPHE